MVRCHQTGVLGGLPTEQGATGHDATLGDAGDDLGYPVGDGPADGDVVLQEQRFGPAHHEVVDDHGDEVESDGVVLVHGLCDRQLGADTVGGRRQQRFAVRASQGEEPGEAAETATHLRSSCLERPRFDQFDGSVACLDVHPGRCIGRAVILIHHRAKG